MKTTVETLEKTLEILEESGWCQGRYHREDTGAYCLWGALEAAVGQTAVPLKTHYGRGQRMQRAGDAVKSVLGIKTSIIAWNDRKGRQFASVRAALKKAIKAERDA